MKKPLFLFLSYLLCIQTISQPYNPSAIDKKAVVLYNQAMQRADEGNLPLAVGLLRQCIDVDARYLDAYLSLAGVYGQLRNYRNCVDYYEKAFAMDSVYSIDYKLPYSINLAGLGEFEKALRAINELLQKKPPKNPTSLKAAEYRKQSYQFAVDHA